MVSLENTAPDELSIKASQVVCDGEILLSGGPPTADNAVTTKLYVENLVNDAATGVGRCNRYNK